MANLDIGISGLHAAQRAIDIIGNNIANAATEGYKRQEIDLRPALSVPMGQQYYGQGVEIEGIRRIVDILLEGEILRQNSYMSQLDRELTVLKSIETSFSELHDNSLNQALDNFFLAIHEFSQQPQSQIYESNVVTMAVALCDKLNSMGDLLSSLQDNILTEAQHIISEVNELSVQLAKLNQEIVSIENSGMAANDLRNERDLILQKLSEFVELNTTEMDDGSLNVTMKPSGAILVIGNTATAGYQVKTYSADQIGISPIGTDDYTTGVSSGRLGGLFNLHNEYVSDLKNQMNTLAASISTEFNKLHTQGVGSEGSFSELGGWTVSTDALGDWTNPPIEAPGKLYIRTTDTSTSPPSVSRESIDVLATDTILSISMKLNTLPGISSSINNHKLQIIADSGYKFDFLPGIVNEPTTAMATGTAQPTISGIYTGSSNQTYTCTISGNGSVGVDSGLQIEVRNGSGELVKTMDVGQGYAAGTIINIDNGIEISLSAGSLFDGETFTVEALATSDETGLLAAAGINTFFKGNTTLSIGVMNDIVSGDRKMAASIGPEMTDNENLQKMYDIYDLGIDSLNGKTLSAYYQGIATGLGQRISITELKFKGSEAVMKNLTTRRDDISGVDINTEATKMMMFQQMFQAMAQYLSVCKETMDDLIRVM